MNDPGKKKFQKGTKVGTNVFSFFSAITGATPKYTAGINESG